MKELTKVEIISNTYTSDILANTSFLINSFIKYIAGKKQDPLIPKLIALGALLVGNSSERTYKVCAMYGIMHTATCIHKNVDNASVEGSFKKIRNVWQSKLAVLLGDLLLSKGMLYAVKNKEYNLLKEISASLNVSTISELNKIKLRNKVIIEEDDYIKFIAKKSTSNVHTCLSLGYKTSSNYTKGEIPESISNDLGLIFQLKADLLKLEKYYKQQTGDYTLLYPFIISYNKTGKEEKSEINNIVRKSRHNKNETKEIQQFISRFQGIEKTKLLIDTLIKNIKKNILKQIDIAQQNNVEELLIKIIH